MRMKLDREPALLSLLEWQERQRRWETVPEDARRELVAELARLMVRVVAREQDGDRSDHG